MENSNLHRDSQSIVLLNKVSVELKYIALNIIKSNGFLFIPASCYWFPHPNINIEKVIFILDKEKKLKVTDAYIDKNKSQTDLIIQSDNNRYKIEFLFDSSDMYNLIANPIDEKINIVIIDFGDLTLHYIYKNLDSLILYNKESKTLLNNDAIIKWIDHFETNINKYKITNRIVKSKLLKGSNYELAHVDQCPVSIRSFLKESFANVRIDCVKCKYYLYNKNNYIYCMAENIFNYYEKIGNKLIIGNYQFNRKITNDLDGISLLINIYVNKLLTTVRSSLIFHEELKFFIMDLGKKLGFFSIVEKKCTYTTQQGNTRKGMIDILWISNKFEIAFEIDSGFRRRSIFKLNKSTFKYAFWIVPVSDYIRKFLRTYDLTHKIILINIPRYREKLSSRSYEYIYRDLIKNYQLK
ncbi:hypothetical protein HLPCO_003189 [Haloplasma contractile SSD-17B]|uniref:Uncharacterized protein n=1 Tax=Haloplasma contractile SSD-17B TaxID=1033810 RepID=F7Q2R1_9MOLU|nr:hypothetical protein [Haloplasma contractile]ERJ10859.1 hypothetical protein HLPCO_003189 [Haloplasma contractile SSD-17B]